MKFELQTVFFCIPVATLTETLAKRGKKLDADKMRAIYLKSLSDKKEICQKKYNNIIYITNSNEIKKITLKEIWYDTTQSFHSLLS